jgi:tryptophanase
MRLTIPRRKYNQAHMDSVVAALDFLYKNRKKAKGLKIVEGSEPKIGIRHFSCKFEFAN